MNDHAAPSAGGTTPLTPHLDARSEPPSETTSEPAQPARHPQNMGPASTGPNLLIRPVKPSDVHHVALLLSLRGRELEQTLAEAPHMIEALPVLLLARLVHPHPNQQYVAPENSLAPPVALAGAFILPATPQHADQWLVTGSIIDPDCPRGGIGRQLLGAVIDAVAALDPAAPLHAVVPADAHAIIALHRSLGFTEADHSSHEELDFGPETALLMVRHGRNHEN